MFNKTKSVDTITAKLHNTLAELDSHSDDQFSDPAEKWDEDDGYEYDDTKPAQAVELDEPGPLRPDYVGLVSGSEYTEGVSEYALVVVTGRDVSLFEMSDSDLRYLGRQIDGLVNTE